MNKLVVALTDGAKKSGLSGPTKKEMYLERTERFPSFPTNIYNQTYSLRGCLDILILSFKLFKMP